MQTLAPILMKGILAASLVFGLVACSGSDFSGSNSRKSLGIGSGADGEDNSGDTDAADVGDAADVDGDVDAADASDADGGYDSSDDSGDDGDIDADGDSGSTDGLDGDDSSDGADDVGLDGGEFNAKLRDPLSIKSLSADEELTFSVAYKKKDGSWSGERSVKIKEGEKTTKTIDGVCRKKDNGTGEMNLKITLAGKETFTSAGEAAKKTGGSGSMVKILADMDGCGAIGTCLDEGKDNTMEISCPKFLMKIDGF